MLRRWAVIIGLLTLCVTLCVIAVRADDYKETYLQLLQSGKYEELFQHLTDWEQADPDNPEIYIAYFNYYYTKN